MAEIKCNCGFIFTKESRLEEDYYMSKDFKNVSVDMKCPKCGEEIVLEFKLQGMLK